MSINDMIDGADHKVGLVNGTPIHEEMEESMERPSLPSFEIPAFLKAKTGTGRVEDYINHPLNFNESKPVARILRGLTGMFNELDFAVVDIVLGVLGMNKKPPVGV